MNKANRETLRYSIFHSFSSFFLSFFKRVYVGMHMYISICVCVCDGVCVCVCDCVCVCV